MTQNDLPTEAHRLPLRIRVSASLLILVHLGAVILPPLAFQTTGQLGNNGMVSTLFRPIQGYCQFLYLNRGYAFFAPDPGASHLIQAAVTTESGEKVESMYPDRNRQWPRLMYHRHFMLAEFLTEIYQPQASPEYLAEIDQESAKNWVRLRSRYEHVRTSIVDHLRHENDGQPVVIRRVEHLIPGNIDYLQEDISLNDPLLYQVLLDAPVGTQSGEPLTDPTIAPEVDGEGAESSETKAEASAQSQEASK